MKKYKYVYGPVSSWRLGRSLGIDLVYTGRGKVCSFDCVYCQAGKTRILTDRRNVFIPTDKVTEEINSLPRLKIDCITFSGAGEPTLAKNLGDTIKKIRKTRKTAKTKIAVLTNASLIYKKDVQNDLSLADFVIVKLDAHREELFSKIDRPIKKIKFERIIKGLKVFRARYKGKLALQIMFTGENKNFAKHIARLARKFKPDEIQINTPLRPCSVRHSPRTTPVSNGACGVRPLSKRELGKIEKIFSATGKCPHIVNVYKAVRKKVNEQMTYGSHMGRRKS